MGGSNGGTIPHQTLVFGLAPALPTLDTTVLPLARPGQSYSASLSASGATAPYTWSLTAGTLPAGLTLSASGQLTGSTTATGMTTLTVKVTDAKGASRTTTLTLAVVATGTALWNAPLGGPDNNAFKPAETTIGLTTAPSLGYRFHLAEPALDSVAGYREAPLVVANRAYVISQDGLLRAWDTTGTTTNRAALWAKGPDPADATRTFASAPNLSYSNGTLVCVDNTSALVAIRATDGARLWRADPAIAPASGKTLTDNGRVFAFSGNNLAAFSLSTGALLWTAPMPDYAGDFATDGTRVYVRSQCTTSALDVATGDVVWSTSSLFPDDNPTSCRDSMSQGATWVSSSSLAPAVVVDLGPDREVSDDTGPFGDDDDVVWFPPESWRVWPSTIRGEPQVALSPIAAASYMVRGRSG